MNTPTRAALSLTLLFTAVHASFALEAPNPPPRPAESSAQRFDQVLYKGVVGNLLEAVPMESEQRTTLQRTNAVVSGALSGKSLAAMAKLAHPGFLIGGLVWGIWAAANIEQPPVNTPVTDAVADAVTEASGAGSIVDSAARRESATTTTAQAVATAPATPHRQKIVRVWLAPSAY
jgi:hypothetical protein